MYFSLGVLEHIRLKRQLNFSRYNFLLLETKNLKELEFYIRNVSDV